MPFHAFLMARMKFGAHTSKTRESTVNIAVSGSSRCMWNCIFSHSEAHAGLARDRNTNLRALASETMSCPHILIQLLAVLIILQPHIHISTCSSLHCERSARSQFVLKFEKSWHFTTQNRQTDLKTNGETNIIQECLFVFFPQLDRSLTQKRKFLLHGTLKIVYQIYHSKQEK